jgi:SNF2 family DNA or RNA helicase
MRPESDMHKYQVRAKNYVLQRDFSALWIDMGLGKTVVCLSVIRDMLNSFDVRKTLIVAPKRVAQKTWPDEIAAWEHTKHLDFQVIKALSTPKREETRWDAAIHIINRELIPWWVNVWGNDWPYDLVILDEASSFKAPGGVRSKALMSVRHKIDRMVELTGTPTSTGLLDLWAQIFLLDRGERLGKTFSFFKDRYFNPVDRDQRMWVPAEGAKEEIYSLISDICVTMKAEDYLELPGFIRNVIKVELPDSLRKKYKEFEREFIMHLEGHKFKVGFAADLRNKLVQFCNGAIYTDKSTSPDRPWKKVHDLKLEALDSILEEASGQPVLLAYHFKSDLARIMARYPQAVEFDGDPTIVDRWNRGEIKLLVAHPASVGHGLNIQFGGHILVWFGLPDSLENFQQFNKRLTDRQGQTEVVIQHYIVVENSVDMTILKNIDSRSMTQLELMVQMKEDAKRRP